MTQETAWVISITGSVYVLIFVAMFVRYSNLEAKHINTVQDLELAERKLDHAKLDLQNLSEENLALRWEMQRMVMRNQHLVSLTQTTIENIRKLYATPKMIVPSNLLELDDRKDPK